MNKITTFFKNRTVMSIIGLIALSLIIWFIGPTVKFGENNFAPLGGAITRLIFIIIILVIWGLNNLRKQLQNNKSNENFVTDLQENQQQNDNSHSSAQSADEVKQIEKRFTDALSTLKRLRFKGKGSSKALYELPWYIIIGPPGSGKTTALVNSTLEFPLAEQFGKEALRGVGGTRNCDWWFTNEAVLIDTAGRYTTQDSHRVVDSTAWEGFLNLLKKNRRRRPINGVIIAISSEGLLNSTEEERLRDAKTIRNRIDELMNKLEIRFPIYLMFTKTDMVSGFLQYFDDLGKDDREQVWGISLPNAPKVSDGPDLNFLKTEFIKLIDRLYERVISRIHHESDGQRRAEILGFPQQMENLQVIINNFVEKTFARNRYDMQPYLRGIYFTSGTQDGTPIDRLMTAVSSSFGFSRDNNPSRLQQGKSFFLGKLFRNVIFTEAGLVGSNKRYETIFRWLQHASYASIVAAGLILFFIWLGSITRHEMYMSEVESYIAEFNAENKRLSSWNRDLKNVLPTLNVLAKASIVYDQETHPWLNSFGLYDGDVDEAADKAYEKQLKLLLLPRLISELELFLKRREGDIYNTFRTYLMFNKLEYLDSEMIVAWFKSTWARRLPGEATARKQLLQHLKNLLSLELIPSDLDRNLVSSIRSLLLRVPVAQRVYSRIRSNPELSETVELLNMFGTSTRRTYRIDNAVTKNLTIPLLFTREGYRNIDFSVSSPLLGNIINERWVLSDDGNARVDFVQNDLDEISKKVKEYYLSDYSTVWKKVHNSLHIAEFSDLRQASEVLTGFTDPVASPLISILEVSKENTELTPPVFANLVDDKLGNSNSKASTFANKFTGNRVDKQFRELNLLLRESSKFPAPISEVIQKIQSLRDFVGEINLSPDPAKKAFEIAKARFQNGAGNAITTLRLYAKNRPLPVKRWLISLADETWKVVLKSAYQYVNNEWKVKVYNPYRRGLAGRYPLSRSSSSELAMYDFSEFFKPQGTMDTFYISYMKPFINRSKGWSNKIVDNHSLGLSKQILSQVRKAQNIKNIFFRANPEVPSIKFQLEPYDMDKKDARFTLEIGDQRVVYNHGPKFGKTLTWTGSDDNTRVRVIFDDINDNQHIKVYEGNWAWFRLQDNSKLRRTKQSNVYLVTYSVSQDVLNRQFRSVRNKHSIVYKIKAKSVNNPFYSNLLGSFRCSERI